MLQQDYRIRSGSMIWVALGKANCNKLPLCIQSEHIPAKAKWKGHIPATKGLLSIALNYLSTTLSTAQAPKHSRVHIALDNRNTATGH
ncbi:hypothetical protein U1Q18_024747 [Sarracenia purpurea var. burkii]